MTQSLIFHTYPSLARLGTRTYLMVKSLVSSSLSLLKKIFSIFVFRLSCPVKGNRA